MIIYYNPDCSKCKQALEFLEESNCEIEIREYLKIPPNVQEIKDLIKLLNCRPIDIVRKGELLFVEKFADKNINDEEWYRILSNHPLLIERPIVIHGTKAIIGRPPQLIIDFIKT